MMAARQMMTGLASEVSALRKLTRLMIATQTATVRKVLMWWFTVFSCLVLGSDRANDAQAGSAVQLTS
jgi:hypothetical protein